MRGGDGDTANVTAGGGTAPPAAPALLPPQPLLANATPALVVVAIGAALVAGFVAFGSPFATTGTSPVTGAADAGKDVIIALAADRAPGAFKILPASFQDAPGSVLAQLGMPEAEKRRLAEKLADGTVRLAAVTLWDTMDEDGDTVEVSAGSFNQTLVIMHKPKLFFLPVLPGGAVVIKAVRDGGGGGVTLGVSTIIGPVPLPPLAVGQSVEIPAL
jgi:hypothetical protein